MSNRNIYNAARGYMVAKAIAGGVASELAAENRRQAVPACDYPSDGGYPCR